MPLGPGKYDDICTKAREDANAIAAAVIIIDGSKGSGFSVTAVEPVHHSVVAGLPELLRYMANEIEKSIAPRGRA